KNYCKTFAITCGADGAFVFDGENLFTTVAYPTEAVDTNGAGDMFAGAFLYAITHGYDYRTAGDFANFASAKVVSQFGPRLKAEQHHELKGAVFKWGFLKGGLVQVEWVLGGSMWGQVS